MLKKVLIGLVAIVAIVLVAAAFMPKEISYSQSIQIDASPSQVWQFTSNLEGLDKWSPWNAKDPEMDQEFSGTSGEVGSKQCWDSENKEVGKGCQEITESEENKHLGTALSFERPRESTGSASIDLEPKDDGTEVTWSMNGPMPWPSNIFLLMMDMEKMMGKEWNQGLTKLKELSENLAKEQAEQALQAAQMEAELEASEDAVDEEAPIE